MPGDCHRSYLIKEISVSCNIFTCEFRLKILLGTEPEVSTFTANTRVNKEEGKTWEKPVHSQKMHVHRSSLWGKRTD